MLAPIAPTDDVAAALLNKEYGAHKYLEANGLRFHYVEAGHPSSTSPLVLFLHGFPEFWYSWRHQLHFLGSHGFHAVALDMRGYGWTDKPDGIAAYNLEMLVQDVSAVIDCLGYGPREDGTPGSGCLLVGHDWGGLVAWAAAHVLGPRRVRGLCVMNCPHPTAFMTQAGLSQFFKSWYFYFFQVPFLPETMLGAGEWTWIGASFRGKRMGLQRPDARMTDTDLLVMKHAFSQPGVARAAVNYYRANMFRRKEKTMEEALAGRLPVPVLVIWGQQDKALEEILVDGTEKHVAHGDKGGGEGGLRVVKIPDASHWVQVDAPAEVNDLLCRFARQVRGEGESQGGRKGGRDGRPCL
ncbi:hypothetical protein NSK_004732 [Nannochloropsis salina CCMP1776]|uniref:AB hydrolase-1 domain-containing protein n=1 Tax=Nannochloropsis salina CCMP1776 TaxID=1027361 RepID=A0A4D9D4R0_9STRA|nr:hypothetical protein NSK_004732 [Nannochloropsis salina CCMP1776]|eukprot:TFJ83628.1 hypothetical protein NSK_004732 [Nannochloropsis salina CCMP1776]